jgi:hypothetical protein
VSSRRIPDPLGEARTVRAYHRTTRDNAEAILPGGFEDAEGSWGTRNLYTGVWVTIDRPWDPIIGGLAPGKDPALIVVEIPLKLFVDHEWIEEGKPYREALIPAEELNRYPRWAAWECVECERIEREGACGWRSALLCDGERLSVCPDHCPEEQQWNQLIARREALRD